jgi:hypothetical protein
MHPGTRALVICSLVVPCVSGGIVHAQHTHGSDLDQRGAMVMGFDQQKTTHHFYLYEDGGAIRVTAKDPADAASRDAIRLHLAHIAMMFGEGDFQDPMLVHDRADVPGTAEMVRLADKISYRYYEIPDGGLVEITTVDPAAVKAVHEFLTFQIRDHQTGDSLAVSERRPRT